MVRKEREEKGEGKIRKGRGKGRKEKGEIEFCDV